MAEGVHVGVLLVKEDGLSLRALQSAQRQWMEDSCVHSRHGDVQSVDLA